MYEPNTNTTGRSPMRLDSWTVSSLFNMRSVKSGAKYPTIGASVSVMGPLAWVIGSRETMIQAVPSRATSKNVIVHSNRVFNMVPFYHEQRSER